MTCQTVHQNQGFGQSTLSAARPGAVGRSAWYSVGPRDEIKSLLANICGQITRQTGGSAGVPTVGRTPYTKIPEGAP